MYFVSLLTSSKMRASAERSLSCVFSLIYILCEHLSQPSAHTDHSIDDIVRQDPERCKYFPNICRTLTSSGPSLELMVSLSYTTSMDIAFTYTYHMPVTKCLLCTLKKLSSSTPLTDINTFPKHNILFEINGIHH